MNRNLINRFANWLRNFRSREMFSDMAFYCRGKVLDVGGWDFYLTARKKGLEFESWTILESSTEHLLDTGEAGLSVIKGDGCNMDFDDGTFDTLLNIQVLEHVFEPIRMVEECARVLKKGGYGIFLIPQTGTLHMEPDHYYNFTAFWIRKVMERSGLEIIRLKPLGGVWSTEASHLLYFILQSLFDRKLKSPIGEKRGPLFYILYPLMLLYAALNIPVAMFLSLGDLSEEANNNLVVVRKL